MRVGAPSSWRSGSSRSSRSRSSASRIGQQTSDNLVLPGTDSQQRDRHPDRAASRSRPTARTRSRCGRRRARSSPTSSTKDAIGNVVDAYKKDHGVQKVGQPALERRRRPAHQGQVDRLHLADAQGQPERAHRRRGADAHRRRRPGQGRRHAASRPAATSARRSPSRARTLRRSSASSRPSSSCSFTFGSAVAMGLPIITALVGLVGGLSIFALLGQSVAGARPRRRRWPR